MVDLILFYVLLLFISVEVVILYLRWLRLKRNRPILSLNADGMRKRVEICNASRGRFLYFNWMLNPDDPFDKAIIQGKSIWLDVMLGGSVNHGIVSGATLVNEKVKDGDNGTKHKQG